MRGDSSLVPRPLPDFISQPWRKIFLHSCEIKSGSGLGTRLGRQSGVAGEGRVVGIPKFYSWSECTMPLMNINSDWMSNASSGLFIILVILYYAGPLTCILGYNFEQSNRTPRSSRRVSAAGLPWLEHFGAQCYT